MIQRTTTMSLGLEDALCTKPKSRVDVNIVQRQYRPTNTLTIVLDILQQGCLMVPFA